MPMTTDEGGRKRAPDPYDPKTGATGNDDPADLDADEDTDADGEVEGDGNELGG